MNEELSEEAYEDLWAIIAEKDVSELRKGEKTVTMYADEKGISIGAARDRLLKHFEAGLLTRRQGPNNAWVYRPVENPPEGA